MFTTNISVVDHETGAEVTWNTATFDKNPYAYLRRKPKVYFTEVKKCRVDKFRAIGDTKLIVPTPKEKKWIEDTCETLQECLQEINGREGWTIGIQQHFKKMVNIGE